MGLPTKYETARLNPVLFEQLAKENIAKGSSVVDVGCGAGNYFAFLRALVGEKGEVWAVEPNAHMRTAAEKEAKKFGVRLAGTRCEELSSLGRKFDVVFASLSLQFCDTEEAICECGKSLEPGGMLLFSIPSKRNGITSANNTASRAFMRDFYSAIRRRLKAEGLPATFDFAYVLGRGNKFMRLLESCGFRIKYWKEFTTTTDGLEKMLRYYTVPWRSERIMPKVGFRKRCSIISSSLKEAFGKHPRFRVARYHIICAAKKA